MPMVLNPQVSRNRDDFDARAGSEREEFRWQRRKVALIASLLASIEPKARGADIGCGTGIAAMEYRRAGIAMVDGFDISTLSLSVAAARGIRARFWNADGCPCPAADGSYDVVIAADIIEHLIDTDMFMSEMHRIIAPGGSLIVSTPNLASWYNRVRLIRGLVPVGFPGVSATSRRDLLVDNNHLRVNVVGEWTNLFQRAGFEVREIRGCAAYFEAWQGGARVAALRALGRFVERVPSLADVLVFILKR